MPCRDKWVVTKKSNQCYECLNAGHMQSECTFGQSCETCGGNKHHSLLCQEDIRKKNFMRVTEGQEEVLSSKKVSSEERNADVRHEEASSESVNCYSALIDGEKKL